MKGLKKAMVSVKARTLPIAKSLSLLISSSHAEPLEVQIYRERRFEPRDQCWYHSRPTAKRWLGTVEPGLHRLAQACKQRRLIAVFINHFAQQKSISRVG